MQTLFNSQTTSQFRLGLDGGGTKTRAVVINSQFEILGSGESGASNPYAVGLKSALDNLEAAADLALAAAQLTRADIAGWGMGLGGISSFKDSADLETALRTRLGNGPRIAAAEDVVAAWSGAFGGELGTVPRALCIAGTGSNCWGRNSRGETANADGAGPTLGDFGSGYWIGESALRHTSRVADGVFPPDALAAAVLAHFQVKERKELFPIIYAADFQRSCIAGLVPVVLQNVDAPAALDILTRAGYELALTSLAVLGKLSDGETVQGEVALIGGVLAYAEPVKLAFLEALQRHAPQTRLVEARYEPAIGAALLV